MKSSPTQPLLRDDQISEGDLQALAVQLGSMEGLDPMGEMGVILAFGGTKDLAGLKNSLARYKEEILFPIEWPAIRKAYEHASRNEFRELVALDRQLSGDARLQPFAAASQRVGRFHIKRLRPLRDQRLVQRYLRLLDEGGVHAWHTLVYGVILALYSFPLRQGLMNYAQQTLHGFIQAAARGHPWTEIEMELALDQLLAGAPTAMESILASPEIPVLPVPAAGAHDVIR